MNLQQELHTVSKPYREHPSIDCVGGNGLWFVSYGGADCVGVFWMTEELPAATEHRGDNTG
jgi:hypothetical protein